MHTLPDYSTARDDAGFSWNVTVTYLAYIKLSGVPIREFFLEPDACIETYRTGLPKARNLFGEDVRYAGPATPPISYGHPNGLGCELLFPEGGEVAADHAYADSLDRAIAALQQPVDFRSAGMAPFYLKFRETMQKAFPNDDIGFSFGEEGPLTTAYVLRGDAFFVDVIDEPEKAQRFLGLLTDSILEFHRFRCSVRGVEPTSPGGSGMCDDVASMIPPRLWRDMVLPFWDQYYCGKTTGKRSAHVEDLRPDQLPFLEDVGLWFFDPSISPLLSPKIIAERGRVPFLWRLGSFHYTTMDEQNVVDFVYQAAADGANQVTTYPEAIMCEDENVPKVMAFIRAAKEVQAMLSDGCTREETGARVSDSGRRKFWDNWLH